MRIIFVPQLPVLMRYSEWWISEFEEHFRNHFDSVVVLGKNILSESNVLAFSDSLETFSNTQLAVRFEMEQIKEFMELELQDDDILFLADLSFPGFFTNILYHKRPKKCFAFCHATSKNRYDYFQPVRKSKWKVEYAHSKMFDRVFVASYYHKFKLGSRWKNISVTALPNPPFKTYKLEKTRNIISVVRPSIQKVNKRLEKKVEKKFGKIWRMTFDNWDDYYKYISESKVMIISAREETYGYQVIDAVLNNCVPIAPIKFSYRDILPREYLYRNEEELYGLVSKVLEEKLVVPELLNQSFVNNFWDRIVNYMKRDF